jgi:tripartite-type tricarboxylate transporter receptor subunit TctC
VPEKLTLLAATTPTRLVAPAQLKDFPDVPTLKEQGWDESVEMFIALIGPKGLPEATLSRLDEAITKLKDNTEYREFVAEKLKMGPVTYGREYAGEYMKKAYDRFGVQAEGMKKK